MIWLVALVAWPAPCGPNQRTVRPIASSTGLARSKAASSPPHMMASVPFWAPSTPPLTGQSRNDAPRAATRAPAVRAVSADTVEQSMTSMPGFRPGASARTTSRTSVSAETQSTSASQSRAKASGVAAAEQPSSRASSLARPALRFQTPCSMPALCRLRAMGAPMAPRPRKPVRMPTSYQPGCRRKKRAATARSPPDRHRGMVMSQGMINWCRRARCARWCRDLRARTPPGRAVPPAGRRP